MARAPSPPFDPATDAAGLLRRVGFATLMLALPLTALVTRRGIVVLAPIGVVLLVLATVLDGSNRSLRDGLRTFATSRAGVASALVVVWCALSLLWTPFVGPASERFLNIVATIAVAVAGYLALPDRMRSANLYIVPVGTAMAALLAIALALLAAPVSGDDDEWQSLERGLVVLVLMLWPSAAWLRSRQRDLEALALVVVVAIAAMFGPQPMPLIALGAGAAIYALTAINPRVGVRLTATVTAALLALAPLVPLLLRPTLSGLLGRTDATIASLSVWHQVIVNEPLRLITGHGFETALRGRFVGLLPPNAPNTLLFEVWYELGIVGALAGAVALYYSIVGAGRDQPPLVPGIMAAFASAFAFACLGIGTAQMWWFTALAVVILIFVAAERGQFRTTRPKASFLRHANDR